jgi:hypothetical protein
MSEALYFYAFALTSILQPISPAKAVPVAFGILLVVRLSSFNRIYSCDIGVYQTVKNVNASYDALVYLFESIGRFLERLEIYTKTTLSEATKEIVVKVVKETISILAMETKRTLVESRSKSFPY